LGGSKAVAARIEMKGNLMTMAEQARRGVAFVAAVKAAGKPVTFLVGEGYNHFEMFETLGNPYGLLGRATLEQMRLTRG